MVERQKETTGSGCPVSITTAPVELVEASQEVCRICFGSESSEQDHLVRPCLCSGSVAFIHESCLRHWVESRAQAEPTCEICQAKLRIQTTTQNTWSFCAFLRSSSCLIIPLAIPMVVVLIVTISNVVEDLSDKVNLGIFLGCIGGLALTLLVATILIVRSCRTKRILKWKVLPQHSEESLSYAIPQV